MIELLNDSEKRMLVSGNSEDLKIAAALMANKQIIQKSVYAYESQDYWTTIMSLDTVKELQTQYPEMIITGSIALFFNGVRLERWRQTGYRPDLDIILPYYQLFEDTSNLTFGENSMKTSGNDFNYGMSVKYGNNWSQIDVKIEATRMYDKVKYNNFVYKVAMPEDIIMAKINYANKPNGQKHKEDIREMIGSLAFRNHLKDLK